MRAKLVAGSGNICEERGDIGIPESKCLVLYSAAGWGSTQCLNLPSVLGLELGFEKAV